MSEPTYEAPAIVEIGTLHDLTLTATKDFTGIDGEILAPDIPLGNVS
jgi:hypothetical protein